MIFAVALVCFGWDLSAERHFVDESAYISQSFYADLFREGRWNHPAWMDYAGVDLPPLPKYLIGLEFWVEGYRRPTLTDARSWYDNTSRQFVPLPALVAARRPSVALGAVGCVAILWLGTLAIDHRVGFLAALLLAINPLYRLHARRAMSDVPAECLILLSLVFGLLAWKRVATQPPTLRAGLLVVLAGVMVGLATLSKLNGVLSGLVLASWIALGLASRVFATRSKVFLVGGAGVAAAVAFATFVVLNPFLTAQPPRPFAPEIASGAEMNFGQRVLAVYHHRASVSKIAMKSFPRDALPGLVDRIAVFVVQGFGRFGPFGPQGRSDSTIRFDWRQDWGAPLWLPCVVLGLALLLVRGLGQIRRGEPPLAWTIVAYFTVVGAVVTSFLPLAWDRYLMSIQPPAALVGAALLVAAFDRFRNRRLPPTKDSH